MKLFLLAFVSYFSFSVAHANADCISIFELQSAPTVDVESYLLPRELHLKPDFLKHLAQTQHEPLLRSISNIYKSLNGFSYYYLPLVIKKSAELKSKDLLAPRPQDAQLWSFDTQAESFKRAYTVLKGVTIEELVKLSGGSSLDNVTGEKVEFALSEADLILFAHLAAKAVPTAGPELISVGDRTFVPFSRRLTELVSDKRHAPVFANLFRGGIEMSYMSSKYQETAIQLEKNSGVQHDSFDKILQLTEKLKTGRSLGKQENFTLQTVFFKLFMVTFDKSRFLGGSVINGEPTVKRSEFLRQLDKTLEAHTAGNTFFRMYAVDTLTYAFLGERVAPFADSFVQILNAAATLLLLPAKNEYSRIKAQSAQDAIRTGTVAATTTSTPVVVDFNGNSSKDPFAPAPVKTREKTRGKADERASQDLASTNVEESTRTIEHLIERGSVQWGTMLEPNVTYQVQFERHFGQFREKQDFIFNEEVVLWLNEHPAVAEQFMEAIKMGMSPQGTGHSGVKILNQIPRNFSGRLYEVKITEKYRMVLVHENGQWQAIMIADKDHFDNQIRHL